MFEAQLEEQTADLSNLAQLITARTPERLIRFLALLGRSGIYLYLLLQLEHLYYFLHPFE